MAVPKRRTSSMKRNQRRANHDKVSAPNLIPCPECGDMMRSHRVCPACGHYKGKHIVVAKEKHSPEHNYADHDQEDHDHDHDHDQEDHDHG